jgi:hypothetical protein
VGTGAVILGSLLCHDILRTPRTHVLKRGLIGAEPGIELLSLSFLRLGHPAFPYQMGIIRPVEMKLGRVGAVLVVPTPTAACGYPGWMMIDTAVVGTKGGGLYASVSSLVKSNDFYVIP